MSALNCPKKRDQDLALGSALVIVFGTVLRGRMALARHSGLQRVRDLLCDPGDVTSPLWTSVSMSIKQGVALAGPQSLEGA